MHIGHFILCLTETLFFAKSKIITAFLEQPKILNLALSHSVTQLLSYPKSHDTLTVTGRNRALESWMFRSPSVSVTQLLSYPKRHDTLTVIGQNRALESWMF